MLRIAGIDVGKRGAVADISVEDKEIVKVDFRDLKEFFTEKWGYDFFLFNPLRDFLRNFDIVFIEKVHGRPSDGGARAFNFGFLYGQVLSAVSAVSSSYLLAPQTWKSLLRKAYRVDLKDKKDSVVFVERIIKKKVRHDKAEAFLVALAGLYKFYDLKFPA